MATVTSSRGAHADGRIANGTVAGRQPRVSRVVFIGRDLENMGLKEGFEACQAA